LTLQGEFDSQFLMLADTSLNQQPWGSGRLSYKLFLRVS